MPVSLCDHTFSLAFNIHIISIPSHLVTVHGHNVLLRLLLHAVLFICHDGTRSIISVLLWLHLSLHTVHFIAAASRIILYMAAVYSTENSWSTPTWLSIATLTNHCHGTSAHSDIHLGGYSSCSSEKFHLLSCFSSIFNYSFLLEFLPSQSLLHLM